MRGQFQLAAGGGQPPLDGRRAVGPPGPQPGLQDVEAGDLDENEQGVGDLPADLEAPLDVDDQGDAKSLLDGLADRAGGVP